MGVIRRAGRWLLRLTFAGLAVLALTAMAVQVMTSLVLAEHGEGRAMAPVDAIIVLGSGVAGDGRLEYGSRRRVEAAVAAFRAGRARAIIMTGAAGSWSPERSLAARMGAFAIGLGVPAGAVILEENSTTTFENIRFTFAIAEARGFRRLALASDAYHLTRARALAAYFGRPGMALVAAGGLNRESRPDYLRAMVREALAWWYNLYKVAAWEALGQLGYDDAERGGLVR